MATYRVQIARELFGFTTRTRAHWIEADGADHIAAQVRTLYLDWHHRPADVRVRLNSDGNGHVTTVPTPRQPRGRVLAKVLTERAPS